MIDGAVYWRDRGRRFEDEAKAAGWWGIDNQPLVDVLRALHFTSVLDIGCGFGRMADVAMRLKPGVRYLGVDVSPDMIESARQRYPYSEWLCADYRDFRATRKFDLVLAVSSLSYLSPDEIEPVLARLRKWAVRDLVIVDWNEAGERTDVQYGHDWPALLKPSVIVLLGRTSIYHVIRQRP